MGNEIHFLSVLERLGRPANSLCSILLMFCNSSYVCLTDIFLRISYVTKWQIKCGSGVELARSIPKFTLGSFRISSANGMFIASQNLLLTVISTSLSVISSYLMICWWWCCAGVIDNIQLHHLPYLYMEELQLIVYKTIVFIWMRATKYYLAWQGGSYSNLVVMN